MISYQTLCSLAKSSCKSNSGLKILNQFKMKCNRSLLGNVTNEQSKCIQILQAVTVLLLCSVKQRKKKTTKKKKNNKKQQNKQTNKNKNKQTNKQINKTETKWNGYFGQLVIAREAKSGCSTLILCDVYFIISNMNIAPCRDRQH